MLFQYNQYNFESSFKKFLVAENISPVSIKNYLSDLRYFLGWLSLDSSEPLAHLTKETIQAYLTYMQQSQLPSKTINRRLSTLRKFFSFCITQGWIDRNPAKHVENISMAKVNLGSSLQDFKRHLISSGLNTDAVEQKVSDVIGLIDNESSRLDRSQRGSESPKAENRIPNQARNNRSNIQHLTSNIHYITFSILLIFMAFLGAAVFNQFFKKTNLIPSLAYPSTPVKGSRILSFQGRLTDSLGNPITTATNVTFKLYNGKASTDHLYTSGACSITPDPDGVISVLIGKDCGNEIGSNVFTESPNMWLGIMVGSDSEMTPRQQIATVG
ncbi:site-specific integrase, partial [Candidatus Roizmanbacteria bacterium]|nr:site-specific integrase [Candidatus Roizmanbacteria bacterium]